MFAPTLRAALFTVLASTAGHAAGAERDHCVTLATGGGYGAMVRSGDLDAYSSTQGPNVQLEAGYSYCGFRALTLGGSLHYWHGFGESDINGYDFLSVDAVLGVHASVGAVELGVRGGPGVLLFFKPTTPYVYERVPPGASALFTPFVGPELKWWTSKDLGVVLLGDFRLSPFDQGGGQRAVSVGGLIGAVARW